MTRSSGTPHSAARSQPCGCHSSWPVAWASVSIENQQPYSIAICEQRARRVEPLGPAVDLDRGVELRARGEHVVGVELRLRPLADQPAGAVAEDVDVRGGDGAHHPLGHLRRRPCAACECTLATTTSSCDEQVVVEVERAVLEDVDLDAGEDAERRELLVERRDVGQLLRAAARG